MKIPLRDRAQEWLAERVNFVQYPNVRAANSHTKTASRQSFFKHAMPLGKRIDLFFTSLTFLILGLLILFFTGLFFYLFVF